MKTLVIYNKDTKNELFNRSDVLDYEVSNYKESTDIIQSLNKTSSFIQKQMSHYISINETTSIDLTDLIEVLDSINNPLQSYLKEGE